jgi:hypothetical protein
LNTNDFNKDDITIIYIAGYGRSGSTLLDILLSNAKGVRSLGEVVNFYEMCSNSQCDHILTNGFWGKVKEGVLSCLGSDGDKTNTFDHANHMQRRYERFRAGWRLLFSQNQKSLTDYVASTDCLLRAITQANDRGDVFVDSSKTAWLSSWRPYYLYRAGYRVKMIHMVRDGRSVIGSFLKGDNVKMQQGLKDVSFRAPVSRSIFGWVAANIAAFINRKSLPDDCGYLLKFEDLITNPQQQLDELGSFLDIDLGGVASQLKEKGTLEVKDVGFSGNRIIQRESIKIDAEIANTPVLSPLNSLYYWMVAGWLHRIIYK